MKVNKEIENNFKYKADLTSLADFERSIKDYVSEKIAWLDDEKISKDYFKRIEKILKDLRSSMLE